jgi:putative ABC transport system substrate-binding protein
MRAATCVLVLIGLLVSPALSLAQPVASLKRIGILYEDSARLSQVEETLRESFRELGYIEGKTIAFDYRSAARGAGDVGSIARELVQSGVDLVFAIGTPSALAMSKASSSVPIVFVVADPVGIGLVASLARPGGNATGVASLAAESGAKRLELLREALPHATRIAVLANPNNASTGLQLRELESVARNFGFKLRVLNVSRAEDLDEVFAVIRRERLDALVTAADAILNGHLAAIAKRALKIKLPGIAGARVFADSGGLMSFGPNYTALWRRCAVYADKILKGTKPAELPVEQAATFELVINLRTADTLGLRFPQSFLLRADEVIR